MADWPLLSIKCASPTGAAAHVTLNGEQIPGLRALRLEMSGREFNVVHLTLECEVDIEELPVSITAALEAEA